MSIIIQGKNASIQTQFAGNYMDTLINDSVSKDRVSNKPLLLDGVFVTTKNEMLLERLEQFEHDNHVFEKKVKQRRLQEEEAV